MTTYFPKNAQVAFEFLHCLDGDTEVVMDFPPGQVRCIKTASRLMDYLQNCECVMVSNGEKVYVFCLENGKIRLDIIDV